MKTHKTRNGKFIPISKLEDDHLLNIIRFYQRKAKEGLLVCYRSPSLHDSFDDHFFDIVYGEEALENLGYYFYVEEAEKRFRSNK
jgi:hypothetical protein